MNLHTIVHNVISFRAVHKCALPPCGLDVVRFRLVVFAFRQ